LSNAQRKISEEGKAFVIENRAMSSASRMAKLALPNLFPANDRALIGKLSEDLHLNVSWDEYGDQHQNLVRWRLPGALADDEAGYDQEVEDEGGRGGERQCMGRYRKQELPLSGF
jgi:5'-3' exoribonuclease 1